MGLQGIFALDSCNGFSKNGIIPWSSRTDMHFFRSKTINKTIIMGYNTLLSLPNSKPLKNRVNIILTNKTKEEIDKKYLEFNNIVFYNYKQLCDFLDAKTESELEEIFVIGGIKVFELLMPKITNIWLTKFNQSYNCDAFYDYNFHNLIHETIYKNNELTIYKILSSK